MYIQPSRLFLSRLSSLGPSIRLIGHVSSKPCRFPLLMNTGNSTRRTLDISSKIRPGCGSTLGHRYLSTSPAWRNSASVPTPPNTSVENFYIPEPPKVPTFSVEEVITSTTSTLNNGEQTLVELGLGGYTPSGMVQTALEWLHVDVGMPWWQCIAAATVVLRVLMFPLVIKSQKNAAKMANNFPQLQHLQERMSQARNSGNAIETMRYTHEIQTFMKEKDINPFKSMLVPLAQLPIFMSMFFGLRGMANLPVESLKYGGLFWFSDLTVPDPYYLLPAITSATMFLTIKLGTEMGNVPGQGSTIMLKVLKFMPVPMFFFILNFPSALLCYWTVTNLVSLVQAGFLRIPQVRDYFGIDRLEGNLALNDPSKKKKFWESAKEAWENQKITAELRAREQYAMQIHKHKTGPIPKTYKYDPTKQNQPESATSQKILQRGMNAAARKPVK